MTKPMNFPERKRQRQLGALQRIASRDTHNESVTSAARKALEHEWGVLRAAAMRPERRRVRTKKFARDRLRPFARISA